MTSTMREDGVGRVITNALGDTRALTGGPTNGERWLYKGPTEVAVLDELAAVIKTRNEVLEELIEAEREAAAVNARVARLRTEARSFEDRAAATRAAFEVLRDRPAAGPS